MDETNAKNILCVEDEPEMVDLIRLILARRGFNVQGASGGVEGIRLIREKHPDLVLLDLMMPDMDGFEVLRLLRAGRETGHIPIIACTAYRDSAIERRIAEEAFDGHIRKPLKLDELLRRIRESLERGEHAAP